MSSYPPDTGYKLRIQAVRQVTKDEQGNRKKGTVATTIRCKVCGDFAGSITPSKYGVMFQSVVRRRVPLRSNRVTVYRTDPEGSVDGQSVDLVSETFAISVDEQRQIRQQRGGIRRGSAKRDATYALLGDPFCPEFVAARCQGCGRDETVSCGALLRAFRGGRKVVIV